MPECRCLGRSVLIPCDARCGHADTLPGAHLSHLSAAAPLVSTPHYHSDLLTLAAGSSTSAKIVVNITALVNVVKVWTDP